ncbi:MAG: anthranilate phosphoribosyltransferase [Deltaproteobacteria bacterium]|nr:anthranilate phosphoribosyltransferase [Deltaproteobacteria bacterium]
MLATLCERLARGEVADAAAVRAAFAEVLDGKSEPSLIAAALTGLARRGESAAQVAALATLLRARAERLTVRGPCMDTAGLGGDHASTFNISTAAACVVAAAGVPVVKTADREVSSRCGSISLLMAAGLNLEAPLDAVQAGLAATGLAFAPVRRFHPRLAPALAVAETLRAHTLLRSALPLASPAGASCALVGVPERKLLRPLAEAAGLVGLSRAWIVHGADGIDELSVCDVSEVAEWHQGQVHTFTLVPEDVGLMRSFPEGLHGGTPMENAGILRELLSGARHGPLADVVALNAGAALVVAGAARDLAAAVSRAQQLMGQGAPWHLFARLSRLLAGATDR